LSIGLSALLAAMGVGCDPTSDGDGLLLQSE
jgi:hypothetical protein